LGCFQGHIKVYHGFYGVLDKNNRLKMSFWVKKTQALIYQPQKNFSFSNKKN
jgi:hypothetical protein